MQRPTRSYRGLIRSFQISSFAFFAVTEGLRDRPFYSFVLQNHPAVENDHWQIIPSNQLPSGRGKPGMRHFYQWARKHKLLRSTLHGKTSIIVLFFDKDIDDVLGRCLRSAHAIYTDHYAIENYLFVAGDMRLALSIAAQIDTHQVEQLLGGDPDQWRVDAARSWQSWIVCCLLVARLRAPYASFGVSVAQTHTSARTVIRPSNLPELMRRVLLASQVDRKAFLSGLRQSRRRVDRLLAGHCDSIFPGRWYTAFAKDDAAAILKVGLPNLFEERLMVSLQTSLPCSLNWCPNLFAAIARVAALA